MTEFRKIKLIYASKLKENVIGGRIRRKICNVTQNHAQNDQMNFRALKLRFFIPCFKKQKLEVQVENSSYSLHEIFISSTPWNENESIRGGK